MLENLPSFHSPVSSWRMGKFRARGYTYSLPEEKIENKKTKTKQGKHASNLRKFVEFPAISILFYRVVLTERTAACNYFCFRKIRKEIFPIPSAGTDILRNVSFGCFCSLLETVLLSTPWKFFKFSTVFNSMIVKRAVKKLNTCT